ncbi:hypothetical protein [Devosia beringensis]|uniref:hypothetical protein n=1 Tax=Devosia beringensis TaxID=2657486 RepID=UPI00186B63F3|nr:hypothetical protein [Devosia beringensis]
MLVHHAFESTQHLYGAHLILQQGHTVRLEVALTAVDKARPVTVLHYVSAPTGMAQARFNGRVVLRPKIDLSCYSCRAVIDLIELRIDLTKPTQWKWVKFEVDKALGGNCFVESVPSRTVSQTFTVRLQEPVIEELRLVVSALRAVFGLEAEPAISELEISVDFRPVTPDQAARDLMFGVLVRHHLPEINIFEESRGRPRYAWARGKGNSSFVFGDRKTTNSFEKNMLTSEHDRQPPVDATYYVGAEESSVQWSVMDKVKDKQNIGAGTFVALPEVDWRTRIEVTFKEEALRKVGVNTLGDLPEMDFARLQRKFFNFKLATFEARPPGRLKAISDAIELLRAKKFLVGGFLGLAGRDTVRSTKRADTRADLIEQFRLVGRRVPRQLRRGTGTSGTTMAFAELNKLVETALRHLGERVSR